MDRINRIIPPGGQLVLLAAVLAGGCSAGSGEGLDLSGRPLDEGGGVPLAPTFESIQANLFDPVCTVCHSGAAAPQGLRLDAANSFASLVGVPSREVPSVLRVAPGDPDGSYLIQKLEGSASVGDRMPLGGPAVPAETIALVRQWILEGAARSAGLPGSAPAVLSVSRDAAQIVVTFSQVIDASTVNGSTFELVTSGGDGGFFDGNEMLLATGTPFLSLVDARTAVLRVPEVAPDERLRLTIRGSGASFVQNLAGVALDGEFFGGPRSGDGQPGGDFVIELDLGDSPP